MTYGAQTWSLTRAQTKRLVTTQRSMERSIMGIRKKDKIRSSWIRAKTCGKNVVKIIKKLKFNYAGHLARMAEDRWCRRITFWVPYDHKRRRGRPAMRWPDEIRRRVGTPWVRAAQNRKTWEKIGEAYARQEGARYDMT